MKIYSRFWINFNGTQYFNNYGDDNFRQRPLGQAEIFNLTKILGCLQKENISMVIKILLEIQNNFTI